ncbi:MAG TPA: flagellar hook-associated protein FlgL [Polyangiaceae bacterium]|nr:flagellar hook-associated protein FlgL [Polyangiaceae bacterium]
MRVTDGMRQTSLVRTLDQLSQAQQDASNRALTGNRVNKPSDDPAAAAELARIRASSAQADAGLKAASSAENDLTLSESVLAQANDLFTNARELAEQGANASLDANTRADLAKQVGQLKQQLVSIANTKGQNGYLFGGSQTQTQPFDANGNFSGDDDAHMVDLGTGTPTAVNVSGARAFTTAGGLDVFDQLDQLQNALNANDQTAISGTFAGLEAARQQVVGVQTDAGLRIDQMQTTEDVLTQAKTVLASRQHDVAGADQYQAYSDLVTLGQSLEQAVGVAKQVLNVGGMTQS